MTDAAGLRQRPSVVVVGLDCITGLQTARVFAARGVPVVGIASNRRHFCCRTRACSRILTADTSGDGLIDCLLKLGPDQPQKSVLIPCTDNSVLQIATHRAQLDRWYYIAQPDAAIVKMLTDKASFPQFAEAYDLPIPKSYTLSSPTDVQRVTTLVTFPAVLKPPVKTPWWQQHTNRKAVIVDSAEQLLAAFKMYSCWSPTLLLQEWIPGPLENNYTCDAYFNAQSQPLVTFTSQKLRQWPAETGVGSISQECDNPTVRETAIRLFQAADFHGLAYLEMKRHAQTGQYLIIEPNVGRPTGRSTCAEAASVDMLYTMYCDVAGLPLPANQPQRYTGTKWIYWKRDLRASWHGWRRGELTLATWLRSIRGRKHCAVFSWSDAGPFLADWFRILTKSSTAATRRPNEAELAVAELAAAVSQPTAMDMPTATGNPTVAESMTSEAIS